VVGGGVNQCRITCQNPFMDIGGGVGGGGSKRRGIGRGIVQN
jgi:hypothetical protein